VDVILRQDVDTLGLRGEVVNVARGYARNFLLPRGLAEPATPALVRELAKRDQLARRQEAKTTDDARAIAKRVEAIELRFDVNAGPTGSLFGSVTTTNVADRLWEQEKIRVDRRKLSMDTVKRVGRYSVPIELFSDVVASVTLVVAPEGQEVPTVAEIEAAEADAAASEAADAEASAAESAAAEAAIEVAAEEADEPEPDDVETGLVAEADAVAGDEEPPA
jgi:large subunit ribosomal protein L9